MSTKNSLGYLKHGNVRSLHIYWDYLDELYYIENENGSRIELPKEIAEKFAKMLEEAGE